MNVEQVQIIHETIAEGNWIDAANLALAVQYPGDGITVTTREEAFTTLRALETNLGESGKFIEMAVLLWGNEMFDCRPSTVQQVFEEVIKNSKLVIVGASGTSKTFSCGVLFYLHWRMDPYWTAVKLAAPNEVALYTNLFSHLCALHRGACIPMSLDAEMVRVNETDMTISMKDALPEMAIIGILCKQSLVSAGGMRGHKPKTYRKPLHPTLGSSTRLLILIDEASEVSPGAFEDIKTTETSIDSSAGNIKIVISLNPDRVDRRAVELAEPEGGWDIEQVDTLYRWTSKEGWPVMRLDAARFENIVQRKQVFKNMHTYEGYLNLLRAGENSAAYWSKGRGFPPLKDNAWTIIPPSWVQSQRGDPLFVGRVTNGAIFDPAFAGGDKALMGVFRWGDAAGWTNQNGEMIWFRDRTNPEQRKSRYVCVLDQIFILQKTSDHVALVQEMMGRCNQMGISVKDCAIDGTGAGSGVASYAQKFWGDILIINFGHKASDERILAEDNLTAYERFEGKHSELWYAARAWLDPNVCALLINQNVPNAPLFMQLTTRRYRNVKGGRVRVEPKEEWRVRNNNQSPDEADLLCMAVEWCRERGGVLPGLSEKREEDRGTSGEKVSNKTVDEPDSLDIQEWVPGRLED